MYVLRHPRPEILTTELVREPNAYVAPIDLRTSVGGAEGFAPAPLTTRFWGNSH